MQPDLCGPDRAGRGHRTGRPPSLSGTKNRVPAQLGVLPRMAIRHRGRAEVVHRATTPCATVTRCASDARWGSGRAAASLGPPPPGRPGPGQRRAQTGAETGRRWYRVHRVRHGGKQPHARLLQRGRRSIRPGVSAAAPNTRRNTRNRATRYSGPVPVAPSSRTGSTSRTRRDRSATPSWPKPGDFLVKCPPGAHQHARRRPVTRADSATRTARTSTVRRYGGSGRHSCGVRAALVRMARPCYLVDLRDAVTPDSGPPISSSRRPTPRTQ